MSKPEASHSPPEPESTESTRRRILEAALDEFSEHGRAGARVDRIATAAKINKAMIYYHFSSKDNLYREAIADICGRIAGDVAQHALAGGTLEEVLRAIASAYAELFRSRPQLRSIFLDELARPQGEILEVIASALRDSGAPKLLFGRLQEESVSGRMREVDIKQAVTSFITLNLGYVFLHPLIDRLLGIEDTGAFMEERKTALVDLFLHGVEVRS
ncbi:TetR family transcriptional regulator [candidate division GN15 bacterium]|nr:TetR family transcriptional regulator [candidate division GN15 bacterium]